MMYNRPLTIYTAQRRTDKTLHEELTDVQGLFHRLSDSRTISINHDNYVALPKAQQNDLKDICSFIAGNLQGGRRRSGCVLSRCAAVLDADNLPSGGTDDFIRAVTALNVCCCIYSTAKHAPSTPRLRIVFPFGADIPAEQYPLVVRLLCQYIQPEMTQFDPTTIESGRIMYYPAHCQDVTPVYRVHEGAGLLDAVALVQQLPNWQDVSSWPVFSQERAPARLAAKQEDPESKKGIVGAFCRVYNVPAAMDKYLPGVYEETATEGRYTFTGGSTAGGAVLYDNGKFLYSHHATDPVGGKLVNAFDLVRLHRFAELDDTAKAGTFTHQLPSYSKMCELAAADPDVADILAHETLAEASKDFQSAIRDESAALKLTGMAGETFNLDVLRAALQAMGILVRRNLITGRVEISGMPVKYSQEEAVNTLPILLWDVLKTVKIKGANQTAIHSALAVLADENRYNPVLSMLRSVRWDGDNRLPVLLDILHVERDSFYASLIRKWLVQTVALAHNDAKRQEAAEGVLVLQGGQGIGKTTVLRRLAIKPEWLCEGATLDLKNKDDILRVIGVWIAELGELDSTLKKEQTALKAFLTQWNQNPQSFRLTPAEREHLDVLNQRYRECLPGEEEIREALDFDLPRDKWKEFTPGRLKNLLFLGTRTTSQQIGRVLTKLAREESRITFMQNSRSRVKSYILPIRIGLAETAESNL